MNGTRVVGILGGMGPAAGADIARLFVAACTAHMQRSGVQVSDQAFPEHWLAQVPVPDRSAALGQRGFGGHQPLEPMLQAMGKLAALGAQTVAVACNTAHAWHAELQQRFPQIEVLHVAREVARALAGRGVQGGRGDARWVLGHARWLGELGVDLTSAQILANEASNAG